MNSIMLNPYTSTVEVIIERTESGTVRQLLGVARDITHLKETQQALQTFNDTLEQQVLARIASGMTNDEISQDLNIKPQTVRNYISTIYEKINVHSRAQAVVWARERGLMQFDPAI